MGQLMRHCPAAFVCHFCALSSLFPLFSLFSLSPSTRLVHFFIVVAVFNSSQKGESEKKTARQDDEDDFPRPNGLCATASVTATACPAARSYFVQEQRAQRGVRQKI